MNMDKKFEENKKQLNTNNNTINNNKGIYTRYNKPNPIQSQSI